MKKFLRSPLTKAAAFLLILACAAAFTALFADILDWSNGGSYYFESSFEESDALRGMKRRLTSAVFSDSCDGAINALDALDYAKYYIETDTSAASNMGNPKAELAEKLQTECPFWFSLIHEGPELFVWENPEDVAPTVIIEDTFDPNGNLVDKKASEYAKPLTEEEIDEAILARYMDSNGESYDTGNLEWDTRGYKIYAGIDATYYYSAETDWYNAREAVETDIYIMAALLALALGLWIYLLFVCGRKNGDEEIHTLLIDRAFTDVLAAAAIGIICILICFGCLNLVWLNEGSAGDLMAPLAVLCITAATGVFVMWTQSLGRNLKNRSFVSRLLCLKIIKALWRLIKKLWAAAKDCFVSLLGNKISAVITALFTVYSVLVSWTAWTGSFVLAPIVLFAIGIYFLRRYLVQLDKINEGILKISGGDTDFKVEGCDAPVLSDAAAALNSISDGVKISVEREVKAQRMKNELITNVSHDLKTPLTSIISYADLLTDMELSPKEANDYAKIIKQKGDRLKRLTQDLFDISKAESGNETVEPERLDMGLLLRQSMAELNNEIEKSGLNFVTDIPEEEVFVFADGKKLSRVFENLLVNALKYSLEGTRVYVSLKAASGKAAAEIKNISAAPLNFDPSEITERFVRGDASRTTEGSGLGLAIAKSYAELCGGRLEISVDGDLFKASVSLAAVK